MPEVFEELLLCQPSNLCEAVLLPLLFEGTEAML
jgi:hypothetical protein